MNRAEKIEIIVLYVLLVAGGLWHLLGWFQTLMRWFAAPLLIALALVLWWKLYKAFSNLPVRTLLWGFLVLVGGFLFEAIGVKTGWIFGEYTYGDVLQPQINGVPVAIGFAWLGIQISALGMAQWMVRKKINVYALAVLTSFLMVLFDLLMEPSAIYLGYWTWAAGHPLVHNYVGWFSIALLFSIVGARLGLFGKTLPPFARHVYIAQAIYFSLILFKTVIL